MKKNKSYLSYYILRLHKRIYVILCSTLGKEIIIYFQLRLLYYNIFYQTQCVSLI